MFTVRMIQLIESHAETLSEELVRRLERSRECPELLQNVPAYELKKVHVRDLPQSERLVDSQEPIGD